jgi:hypothetical protein
MNALNLQTHEIVIYSNKKRLAGFTSIIVLAFLYLVGRDVFAIWALGNHDEIGTGAWIVVPIVMLWPLFTGLSRLCQRGPAITINSQGFSFPFPLYHPFWLRLRPSLIPWEEIERIAVSRTGMNIWLFLSLKDPVHYWSLYGKGPFRKWRRGFLTRANIDINSYFLSLSASQILQQIEEHYSSQLLTYGVQMKS